jgi:hypothetical protein
MMLLMIMDWSNSKVNSLLFALLEYKFSKFQLHLSYAGDQHNQPSFLNIRLRYGTSYIAGEASQHSDLELSALDLDPCLYKPLAQFFSALAAVSWRPLELLDWCKA